MSRSTWFAIVTMACALGCVEPGPPMDTASDDGLAGMDPSTAAEIGVRLDDTDPDPLPKAILRPPSPTGELAAASGTATPLAITYHGGPVMLGPTKVYLIWYGAWSGNTATTILVDLIGKLGGTPYWNINHAYADGAGRAVPNAIAYGGATTDPYSQGSTIGDAGVWASVQRAIAAGKLPRDPSGVYLVLTSADVAESSGFCSRYCGWHTYGYSSGTKLRFAFVGNAARCPSSCAAQTASSPNGNVGADGMASVVAHELAETVSDPDLNAWYDANGAENADKCAWTFGTTYKAPNGSFANVKLGTRNFLLQQNWLRAGAGACVLKN